MLTVTYETLYASDKKFIIELARTDGCTRRICLQCPGEQYLVAIGRLLTKRGFSFKVIDER